MDAVRPYIAAVSGVKNSGKTTFLEKLVPELVKRGYRVAVIKHDGHDFCGDENGTDTFRLKRAGAYGTCIYSSEKWMVVKEQTGMDAEMLAALFPEADIILVEGLKTSPYPKFEIVRKANSEKSVCARETLLGLITDTDQIIDKVPSLQLDETEKCADILEKEIQMYKLKKKM